MLSPHSPPSLLLLFLLLLFSVLLPPSLLSPTPPLSHSPLRWTSPHDPCYHLDGRPRHCLSEFINAAYGVPVAAGHPSRASSPPERNVSALTDLHNPHNLTCLSGEPWEGDWAVTVPLGRRFEITYISLQFCQQGELSEGQSISILKSMDHGQSWRPLQYYSSDCPAAFGQPAQSVALTRHQETEPLCSDPRPLQKHRGGSVLAFSTLDGRPSAADLDFSPVLQDWVTATDIRVVFHKPRARTGQQQQGGAVAAGGKSGEGGSTGGVLRWRAGTKSDAVAQAERDRGAGGEGGGGGGARGGGAGGGGGDRLLWGSEGKELMKIEVENSKENRRGERAEKGARRNGSSKSVSQEETQNTTRKEHDGDATATGSPSSSRKGKGRRRKKEGQHWKPCQGGACDWTVEPPDKTSRSQELRRRRNHGEGRGSRGRSGGGGGGGGSAAVLPFGPSALSAPAPIRPPVSLSDLQVGGRCKCNGHASRCRRDNQGQAVCQCEHHTAGPDCDVCKPFYYDRPWHRATPTQPHPCVPCECNGHSTKCRFSMEIYQQSGRQSGGVCLKCRHHTGGRHCQFCQNGYTRDQSKPLTHRKACQPCQCHPLGAVGRWCNQSTGQCLCREGVMGQRCNRCAPGYKQGRSPLRPCLKIQEVPAPTPVYQPQYSRAEECQSYCHPSSVKVRMNLDTFCLKDYVLKMQVKGMERSGPWWQFSIWVQSVFRVGSSRVRRGQQALWVPDRDLGCGCPTLQVGRTFLLIGAEDGARNSAPGEHRLVADRSTIALHWREHWSPKLRGFRAQDKKGKCLEVARGNATARSRHTHTSTEEYTPPHLEQGPRGGEDEDEEDDDAPHTPHTPHAGRQRADAHAAAARQDAHTHDAHAHKHRHKSQRTHTHAAGGSQKHTHHTHRDGHDGDHDNDDEGRPTAVDGPHETTSPQFNQNALQHAPNPSSAPTAVSLDNKKHLFSTVCPTLPPHDNPV